MAHQQYQSCIDACDTCAQACHHCATACLQEPVVKMLARCIALDMDCAAACRLATGYMSRGSEAAKQACAFCAQIGRLCADECAKHKMDHCKACADARRRCAEECERMAA